MPSTRTRVAKQKLAKTPTKSRMPSEEATPPKRSKPVADDSPMSSPIRGPLQEDANKDSPTFIAKCFYGLKKSQLSKENVLHREEKTDKLSDDPKSSKKIRLGNGKTAVSKSRIDELMLERIAMSPVKQAVLETCSMHEFRKIYRNEYEQLQRELDLENRRLTRRTSNIVTRKNEEEEYLDDFYDDSSDDEVTFAIQNGFDRDISEHNHLDDDSEAGDSGRGPANKNHLKTGVRNMLAIKNGELEISDESDGDSIADQESKTARMFMKSNVINGNGDAIISTPQTEFSHITTPISSGRKFFKTRSPLEAAKASSVVFGKGFNLRFHPKSPKPYDKKTRAALKRKSDGTPKRSRLSMPGKVPFLEKTFNGKSRSDLSTTTDSHPGFSFAPGFLTPEKNSPKISEAVSPFSNEQCEELNVNKVNSHTYEVSPQNNKPLYENEEKDSNHDSASNSEDSNIFGEPINGQQVKISDPSEGLSCKVNAERRHKTASPEQKLFPIFGKKSISNALSSAAVPKNSDSSPIRRTTKQPKDDGQSQMIIDAGQKFDMIQCSVCSMLYCEADSTDAAAHAKFHKRLTEALKFPGWKKERVMQEYPMDLGRVLLVLPDDPKHCKKKIQEVNQIMGRELGFPDAAPALNNPYHKIFLYIVDKEIAGCCIAEPITQGFRIIPSFLDEKEESGQRPWCCAKVSEPVCVGISRLWVAAEYRKTGVATKLVDCVRQWFDYGTLIPKHMLAFSDPTPDGRKFAQKYMGSPTFLVYRYNHY